MTVLLLRCIRDVLATSSRHLISSSSYPLLYGSSNIVDRSVAAAVRFSSLRKNRILARRFCRRVSAIQFSGWPAIAGHTQGLDQLTVPKAYTVTGG